MDPRIVAALACPHEGGRLTLEERTLGCAAGHRFDLTRQGTATLIDTPLRTSGDPAALLDRRQRVHDAGVLAAVHRAVADEARATQAEDPDPGLVCEVGAGPGTYLAASLEVLPDHVGLAVDISKAAVRRAARCHPRAAAIVADVWRGLPLADASVSLLLVVFAPRNPECFARIVRPGGHAVVVTPLPDHLDELRGGQRLLEVPEDKASDVAASLAGSFTLAASTVVRTPAPIDPALAADLAGMGPSGYHAEAAATATAPDEVTVAVTVQRFRRRTQRSSAAPAARAG